MPSQTVREFRPSPVRSAAVASRSYIVTGNVVSICDSPAYTKAAEDDPAPSNPDGLGCARGVSAAFVLEGGLALLAYGIWHLWRLVH